MTLAALSAIKAAVFCFTRASGTWTALPSFPHIIQHRATNTNGGSGGISPCILNLDSWLLHSPQPQPRATGSIGPRTAEVSPARDLVTILTEPTQLHEVKCVESNCAPMIPAVLSDPGHESRSQHGLSLGASACSHHTATVNITQSVWHVNSYHLPGLHCLLQWYGLQQMYTVSLEDLQTGKRFSSAACLRSGHRQSWQHSRRGSNRGGWSRGNRTHADKSAPRLSTAASNISNWLSLNRFSKSLRTISPLRHCCCCSSEQGFVCLLP